jgi:flagellar hook-associated protein 2
MATFSIGGLASGLDTNEILTKLVALERRRSVDLLQVEQQEARGRQGALGELGTRLAALKAAVDKLRDPAQALARRATSSDPDVLGATAGSGALTGTTEITVHTLARGSIAASASGKTSADATVAAGPGSFTFQVGSEDPQTIAIDATTTLSGLASAINALGAGASASVVNLGTSSSPDYRLRIASRDTGTANAVAIVADDTDLGVAETQTALDASFSVSGFATPLTRSSNVVNDVIPGVTLSLEDAGGPVTVSVATDADAVRTDLEAVVAKFNDVVAYVSQQSAVTQGTSSEDRDVVAGPLAFDGTVRSILEGLRTSVSATVDDLAGGFSLLAEIGLTSTRDGTLELDGERLEAALAEDEAGVAELFAGLGAGSGVFDRVSDYLGGVTQADGLLETRTDSVAASIDSLQSRIDAGERLVAAFEANLRDTFINLELIVSRLQSQSAFILSALGGAS